MMLTSATTVAASRVVVAPRASAAKKASRAQFGAVRGFDPLRYVSTFRVATRVMTTRFFRCHG
jgi:hypothetical protein